VRDVITADFVLPASCCEAQGRLSGSAEVAT
jgi:hypothetical protein